MTSTSTRQSATTVPATLRTARLTRTIIRNTATAATKRRDDAEKWAPGPKDSGAFRLTGQLYSWPRRLYRPDMTVQPTESILIVDFGSQVTQLIARRVREAGVYCEIAPFNSSEDAFQRLQPKGVIFSGGPASVTEAESPRAPQVLFDSGVP